VGAFLDLLLKSFETSNPEGFGFEYPNFDSSLQFHIDLNLHHVDSYTYASHQVLSQASEDFGPLSSLHSTANSHQQGVFEGFPFCEGLHPNTGARNDCSVTISEELSLDTLLGNPPDPLLNHLDNQAALEEELRSAETVDNFAHSAVLDINFVFGAPEGSDLVPFVPFPTRGHTPTISPADNLLFDLDSRPTISETQHTTPTSSLSSIPSPDSGPVDSAQPSTFPNEAGITCAWPGCQEVFSTVSGYK
jgi:hypothetical protein